MILENYWKKSKNSLNKGRTEAPFAYVIPAEQERKFNVSAMVDLLRRQGIEMHRATDDGVFDSVEVSEGDFILRMDQPYRNFALTLMSKQEFPADAPTPYDDVAWTYPLHFNVEAFTVEDSSIQSELEMEQVTELVSVPGEVVGGSGDVYLVQPNAAANLMAARLALGDIPVFVVEGEIEVDDDVVLAPGAWVLETVMPEQVESWARDHGFTAYRVGDRVLEGAATHELDLPRIALLHTWTRTQDEGWARYTLDQQGVHYDYIGEDRIGQIGFLKDRYDVLLFPHQGAGNTARSIFQGLDPDDGPLAYTRTAEYPTHGYPDSSSNMVGGMGYEGLMAIRDFVHEGGTFIAVGSAATLPVEFGMLRDVTIQAQGSTFIPGSILNGEVARSDHPLVYGYGEGLPLYHQYGPYFSVSEDREGGIAVTYASEGELVLSGLARGGQSLKGEPAVYVERVGEGFIVIYGFDALHRHQNLGNHALVWNALLNWNDLDAGEGGGESEH
jgi:hypothetical protein